MGNTLVRMENITKVFGSVAANKDINLTVNKGEIHSILGENGAGKSTLMNILSGVYSPDSGSIFIKDNKVSINSPKDAINLGIGMIYQHFKLVDILTAKENIIAGQKGKVFINSKKLSEEIKELSVKMGLEIDPDRKVYNMSVAEKQRLEILKVLYRGAEVLILDEPTAVLTPQETEKLFSIIKKMRDEGSAIIIITHKLNEVMEISDRVTVLRNGKVVGTVKKEETNERELANLMVGHAIDLSVKRLEMEKKSKTLCVKNLCAFNKENIEILNNVSFDVHQGEILGVAGVAGSGQKELCDAIAGLYPVSSGEIVFQNKNIVGKNPGDIIKMGISMSFVPEDRLGMGLVGSMDIVDNVLLKYYKKQKGLMIKRRAVGVKAENIVEKLNISTPSVHHPVKKLSGGNIQKVLLGREIGLNPKLMITAYPARGLDVGSAHMVYDLLNEQKAKGVSILFIGEDLDVLMQLCDRVMVMCEGKVTEIVDPRKCSKSDIGLMMAGETLKKVVGCDD
ncbi:MAG TPA: ABC transporter ATP-binding protein [Clostridiaceae bacterium]|jgi:simple sugar transport system ATP-binding protein|nr:ABC transporter ATP-binding protein [Clostridiaceae bacterium]HBF77274.1 ABC transporter ATP-binding protein [Clostridiaceae bacterium]HBG38565.1 ABC transporter ATP-binding protein [Clostridiaceae bacterium]HBN29276.1 ABC transporter ATP-binding protein [Clostridiaceae bacterium]HBX47942.1 ABC transporter ATP-binding protein [Clostridiaceae bacterium]